MKKINTKADFLDEVSQSIDRRLGDNNHTLSNANTTNANTTNANTEYKADAKMDNLIKKQGRPAVFGEYRNNKYTIPV